MIALVLNESPMELTTSATDAVLAIECVVIIVCLRRLAVGDRWRTTLWCWVFGLIGFSSVLGAVAHGLTLSDPIRAALWRPLYLCLGIVVALFMVGAVYDWRGRAVAARLVPWCIGVGSAFFALTEVFSGEFLVFVAYEATAMVGAFGIYLFLGVTGRLRGAGVIATAVLLNLLAAAMQATDVSLHLLFPFDHNGVFHLIQMAGLGTLGLGLSLGMQSETPDGVSEPGSAANRSQPIRSETNRTSSADDGSTP
jgi:hypothetical protein